jgi:hypothetical protein
LKQELFQTRNEPRKPLSGGSHSEDETLGNMRIQYLPQKAKHKIKSKQRSILHDRAHACLVDKLFSLKHGILYIVDLPTKTIELFVKAKYQIDQMESEYKQKEYLEYLHSQMQKSSHETIWAYSTFDSSATLMWDIHSRVA